MGQGINSFDIFPQRFMGFPNEEEIAEEPSTSSDSGTTLIPVDEPVGCFAFHIKHCKDFTNTLVLKESMQLMIRITVGQIKKCTEPHYIRKLIKMKKSQVLIPFEEIKYFIAQIPKRKTDERNKIAVELLGLEQSSEVQRLLGQTHFHLIDIVKQGSVTETFELGIRNLHVCDLDMSIDFSYGYFGYGYSNQLKQVEKDKTSINSSSLFLRIPPLENRKDEANNVITYQTMPYPAFLPKELQVSVGSLAKDRERETAVAESTEYFTRIPHSILQLMKMRKRLEALRLEYNAKKTQEQRIDFLEQLILRKMGTSGKIPQSERRDKASFSPDGQTTFSSEYYQPEGPPSAVENGETSSGDEAKTNMVHRLSDLLAQKAESQATSSGMKTKLPVSGNQLSSSVIVSMINLQNPFLKFLKWMHRIFQRITPGNPDNVIPVKLEAKSDVLEPQPERLQSFSAAEHRRVDVSNQYSSILFQSPEITIQEDTHDDKGLEQTKPGPFYTGSNPAQLHFPMEDTLPSSAMLHEKTWLPPRQFSYAERKNSQEIIGGLLSISLSQYVPLGSTSSDVGSHDNSKLKATEDQGYLEKANSIRFSSNPSINVHSSKIQGDQQKKVVVEVTSVSQTASPETTEDSAGSSPRGGYKKYSKKKQDSPSNLIPSSTGILVDPPKKHQIYLVDTLIPETWRDLAAESEVAFREQSSSRNNKQNTEMSSSTDASIKTRNEFSPRGIEADQSEASGFSTNKFQSPEITIQEDKHDDKGLEQTKPGPFYTGSNPAQLHFPMEDTLPSSAMLHEKTWLPPRQFSYAERKNSQEIFGSLLSISLSEYVPLGSTSSDGGSHDNSKLKATEDQGYLEKANSIRFSSNPSINVHSSKIQGDQQKKVVVEVTSVSQTASPESTEDSAGSSPRGGYKKYSKKKQDSPSNLIPSSTGILVDPPKKHQIYLVDTLIPETWRDLAAESEVAFREQSSSRNNKQNTEMSSSTDASIKTRNEFSPRGIEADQSEASEFSTNKQFTGGQLAVPLSKYESSDIDAEQDESSLSARGSSSVQTSGRRTSFSIKTFESSEGSFESSPDQAVDIPYSAASPNNQTSGRRTSFSIKTFESSEGSFESSPDQAVDIPYSAASPNNQTCGRRSSFSIKTFESSEGSFESSPDQAEDILYSVASPKNQTSGRRSSFSIKTFESSEGSFESSPDQAEDIPYSVASPKNQTSGRRSSFSIKTFESSEGSFESSPDQAEDIPYSAASPNNQGKINLSLEAPKDLQAGQVEASFSAIGKDTTISTVFVDQVLLGDDTKVKTKLPEVDHQDSYQWAEASSRRGSETEEQQEGPSTSSGKEAREDGTAGTPRVADAFPLDSPSIETISDETNQMRSDPHRKNYVGRHLMVDPSMSDSSMESNMSSQHSTITEITKPPPGGLIKSAGRHTVNLTEHKPSLSSIGDQDTAATQSETTRNSMSVSDRETTELTKTEATSEEVFGQTSSQQEDPALNIEESRQEYTRGKMRLSLPRIHYLVEANDTTPQYHSLVEISKPASSSQAQSSKHDQQTKDAALLKVPTNVKKEHKSERGSKLNQPSKSLKKYQSRHQTSALRARSSSVSQKSESESEEKTRLKTMMSDEGVPARAASGQDAEGENQLLSDVQLNVATETFMPSVGVQTRTEVTQTRTTSNEVSLGDNLQQETEVPTGTESRQDVERKDPGDQTLSDVQLDVDTGTSVSSLGDQLGKKTSGAQGSGKPPQPSSNQTETSDLAQQKEDIFANMIASAMKEVEMEQRSAEAQKHHPKPTERCKKAILFPEVVVADQEKGILGFKMHKYVLEQDRTVAAKQYKSKSGSAKSHSTCKYVRKNEDSRKRQESRQTSLITQNADPQLITSTAPNNEHVQQSDEVEVILPKEGPHRQSSES